MQYEWLRRLASPRLATAASAYSSVFCAADDDQAIYAWRGAERNNVLRFQHDFPGLALIRLPRTYRCSPHVLGAAQALAPTRIPLPQPQPASPIPAPTPTCPQTFLWCKKNVFLVVL